MDTPSIAALKRALELLGSQGAVGEAVGVTQSAVSQMVNGGKVVPAEWCLPLERATAGAVTRHELRPDIYPLEDAAQ